MLILEITAKYDGGQSQRIMTLNTNLCVLDDELNKIEEKFKVVKDYKWVELPKEKL